MEEVTVIINGVTYQASPLKCKHLKLITSMLEKTTTPLGVYNSLERWFPFILDSIKTRNADFSLEKLEDATIQEINNAWEAIMNISGIKVVTKQTGESKPTEESTGQQSTQDSQPQSATTIG